ncbi:hypothetical protein HPP92_025489 [Vanilla planifolia]|uniref:Uncharacterized protein n=1 Tax=Vanilla planifolia TaxID=51239 RepID=A0A835PKQ5_VANPL|nr:hypothetical protein HPP92_025489 [Vanilla planifolia]
MFLPELHVAQQSRRDKLRVPPPLPPSAAAFHHIYDASVFPPAFDLPSSAVAGCVSDSSPFFNQFEGGGGGGGSGIWKGGDWTSGGPPLHFLALLPILPTRRGELVFCLSVNKPRPRDSLLDGANELLLLPSYAGSTTAAWTTGLPVNGSGKGEGVFCGAASSESTQGLVLSLSSNPPQRYASGDGGAIAEGGSQVGGLWGPFTGYATVLKCSKFLKPAQQLLDEFCILGDWFDVI